MSLWKTLFGRSSSGPGPSASMPATIHNGFAITAAPVASDGKFHVAGTISKEIGGEIKEHRFIRADTFPSAEAAAEYSIIKAKQIIDQMGDRIFS